MANKCDKWEFKTPAINNRSAQMVRAYRYTHRLHATKKGCAEEMGLSRTTVTHWWPYCEVTDEDKEKIDDVKKWIIEHHSDNYRHCSVDLNRDPDEVKADMTVLHLWYDDRI